MKLAPQSVPARESGPRPAAAAQSVTVARSGGGKHPPVTGRREPPKPSEAKPKLSDFETELLAAWDS